MFYEYYSLPNNIYSFYYIYTLVNHKLNQLGNVPITTESGEHCINTSIIQNDCLRKLHYAVTFYSTIVDLCWPLLTSVDFGWLSLTKFDGCHSGGGL